MPAVPVHVLLGIVGVLALAGGIVSIVGAVLRWRREKRGAEAHASATGRIAARFLPKGGEIRPSPPRYTIDFTTADGRAVRFETDSVGWTPKEVKGEVTVLYDPTDPERAFVRGGERVAAILIAVAGVVFTLVGLLMALSALDVATRQNGG